MKLLLHICCAPCSVYCVKFLRAEGLSPDGYFFNPNIHPVTEYRARRDALTQYAESIALPLHIEDDYGLREFVKNTVADLDHRCAYCYRARLGAAAKYAAEYGYDAFTTTLFVSPYQNHEL
jgi:predicted adenine nucleotide alpha hydrolase (AANH) superfamily ATPase